MALKRTVEVKLALSWNDINAYDVNGNTAMHGAAISRCHLSACWLNASCP
jgi:hypothetical protein